MSDVLDYAPLPDRRPINWLRIVGNFTAPALWIALVGPLWLIAAPIAIVGAIALLLKRRWRLGLIVASTSPFTIFTVIGVLSYALGGASLEGMGLMREPNVDPDTRLQYTTGGCMVDGNEWMWQLPNNLAVISMVNLFGPGRSFCL